ncbi:MFS general substrate transporter [Lentinus tigrinus ALCF2SS1-7]|uniref:MFS general substrate transporter n=1 Tax=Lentinus tigrinus ALCF2SS1-7 TaxID=1328758 RepID=UPI0011661050|nr:MFS general substrate transporter [Lentinus tigrinus ALCF2SS1-7]
MHTSHANHPPPLFSAVRIISFLTCILVALASGTNYVAYGPQLGSRLHLTHTQINIVGLFGNIGVYSTAPLWGGIVDRKGPAIMMVIAFFGLLSGYLGIRHFFDAGLPDGESISLLSFCALVFCDFLTGIGGNGGLVGGMNATAKSWPDHNRATANGIVISGFGLSAFLFSTIAHTLFPGNTSEFLLTLAIGTSLPMILGFFFIRRIPPPHIDSTARAEHGSIDDPSDYGVGEGLGAGSPTTYSVDNNSHTHLLARDVEDDEEPQESAIELEEEDEPLVGSAHAQAASDYVVPATSDAVMLSPTHEGFARHRSHSSRSMSRRSVRSQLDKIDGVVNIHGKRMFATLDFWILFCIASLLSGTGLMYINNVGAISQSLFAFNNPDYDEVKAAQWQATQVSTVSLMNCLGRILIGVTADFTKSKLRLPRSFCIILVAAMFVISQLACFAINDISNLWKASVLLGLAYGGLFGLLPTIVIDWFGLTHFSENYGFVSLSPLFGGNIFSIMFGRNLDSHDTGDDLPASNNTLISIALSAVASLASPTPTSTSMLGDVLTSASSSLPISARGGIPSSHHCIIGRECYVDSIKVTIVATIVALGLGVYASWRDLKKQRKWASRAQGAPAVVIWETED